MACFQCGNTLKEQAKTGGVMINVKFVNQFAIGQANSNAMASTANIDTNAKGVRVHQRLLRENEAWKKSSLRLVYIQSHDQQVIGTIPVGVSDDVVDEGGISESSSVRFQTREPHEPHPRQAEMLLFLLTVVIHKFNGRPRYDRNVTDAAVHDSQVFEALLDHSEDESGKKRAIYADSAYRSQEKEASLATANIARQICEKGARNQPLTAEQKASNTEKSRVRVRVEHVFGAQAQRGGHIVRTIGLLRAEVKIGMMNLVYNMMRLGQLLRRDGRVASAVA